MKATEIAILEWATKAFGFDVLWVDGVTPRLPVPYATMRWFSDVMLGFADPFKIGLALDVSEQVQETWRLTIQLEVYSKPPGDLSTPDAMQIIEGALLTLQADETIRSFRDAKISFLSHEKILEMDEQAGDRWERRSLCDIHFLHVITNTAESIGRIDEAVPTITINQ